MDFFLILFYLLFASILLFPFGFLYWRDANGYKAKEDNFHPLMARRQNLVESLRDLKVEWDTGHLQKSEWESLSAQLFQDLDQLDKEIASTSRQNQDSKPSVITPTQTTASTSTMDLPPTKSSLDRMFCFSCGSKLPTANAKFCPFCGTSQDLSGSSQLA